MGEPSSFCVVLVTTATGDEARAIAHTLVQQSLAACVNIVPIQSIYTWDGAVQEDSEWQLIIKTRTSCWTALEQTIRSLHPYDVPEMICLPIEAGFAPYLSWITEMTSPNQLPQ
ncbi:MAG: divalent-cation tolerance protein CutA [Leptolyngbyaceae bacterium]|nr:divalent-cation tolerance protein CutA [Leptolyngbyaceae bacterium]